ncbi:MAG TPA: DsrE/DsrF/DrsH-like family protein [Anaerolineales bacterium]|nr:DsrE/DsrF/DrsH-like family protein [Anaerolineales bacterium]
MTTNREKILGLKQTAENGQTQGKKTRKLCIICSKGSLDMAYPPLILANAARMTGIEVDLFFTFWGMDIVTESKVDHLHIATVGNPNMHPKFHIPTMIGGLPGMSSMASAMMRKEIGDLGFPPVREFIEMLHDAGARLWACKMSADMMDVVEPDLLEQVDGVIGAIEFVEMSEDAQVIFV